MRAVFSYGKLQVSHYRQLTRSVFVMVCAIAFIIYCLLRLCLYGDALSFVNESQVLLKMTGVSAAITVSLVVFIWLIETAGSLLLRNKQRGG